MSSRAPIALFAYNRPDHLKRVVEALQENDLARESALIILCDGPKTNPEDAARVAEVRGFVRTVSGFKSITVNEQTQNRGLARSVIDGVGRVLSEHDRIIVLEDDLLVSKHFLRFMNDALDLYETNADVISVHGYVYPIPSKLPETFFLKGADCWGWGTWRRGWNLFREDQNQLLEELERQELIDRFNFSNTYDYRAMLAENALGRNDSWAIRWYASALLADKVTLYPGTTLVRNIGLDGSGTHCDSDDRYDSGLATEPVSVSEIPALESSQGYEAFCRYFSGRASRSRLRHLRTLAKSLYRSLTRSSSVAP